VNCVRVYSTTIKNERSRPNIEIKIIAIFKNNRQQFVYHMIFVDLEYQRQKSLLTGWLLRSWKQRLSCVA